MDYRAYQKKKISPCFGNDRSNDLRLHNTLIITLSAYILYCFFTYVSDSRRFSGNNFQRYCFRCYFVLLSGITDKPGEGGNLYYQIIVGLGKRLGKTNCNFCTFINNNKKPSPTRIVHISNNLRTAITSDNWITMNLE